MKRSIPIVLALLVAGCGGGSDHEAVVDPTAQVPDSANRSSEGLVQYLQRLIGADATGREPVGVDTFSPQRPDDREPVEPS